MDWDCWALTWLICSNCGLAGQMEAAWRATKLRPCSQCRWIRFVTQIWSWTSSVRTAICKWSNQIVLCLRFRSQARMVIMVTPSASICMLVTLKWQHGSICRWLMDMQQLPVQFLFTVLSHGSDICHHSRLHATGWMCLLLNVVLLLVSVLMMSVFVCHAAVMQQAHLIYIVQAAASTLKSHVDGFESDSKSLQEVVWIPFRRIGSLSSPIQIN